jgi:hypothetical protein
MGVYTVRGIDARGRTVTRTGTDYDSLLAEVWATIADWEYAFADYLGSGLASTGWWDEAAQYRYIEPVSRVVEVPERDFWTSADPGSTESAGGTDGASRESGRSTRLTNSSPSWRRRPKNFARGSRLAASGSDRASEFTPM